MIVYNPLDIFYKSRTGAVTENERIVLRVTGGYESAVFLYRLDNECEYRRLQMQKINGVFEITVSFEKGLYWYCFELNNNLFIGDDGTSFGKKTDKPKEFLLSVYSQKYNVPGWIKGGIIYQIFPDRFFSSKEKTISEGRYIHLDKTETPSFLPNENGKVLNNDFFGGDINGIIDKLDYIASLNVTAIYLNPIFKAWSNHRYDTGDYMTIDPLLGTEENFKNLISEANKRSIKIILDGVFNHTGDDSLYFNKYGKYNSVGAYYSKNSPYYEWYKFIDFPSDYESWWGIKILPATNKLNQAFIEFISGENGVLDKYLKMGIGGWRLDVVDELPDNFVKKIRSRVKADNSEAVIIGEVWEDASEKISYGIRREYFLGDELDSVMNYQLKDAIIEFAKNGKSDDLSRVIRSQIDRYPYFVINSLMNILSTHDTARLISAVSDTSIVGLTKTELSKIKIGGKELEDALFRVKVATLLQYTLPGVPSIYYGDEVGMQGFCDPLNRKYFEWDKLGCEINKWYKKIGEIRADYSAFVSGNFEELYRDDDVYVFKRFDEQSEVLITINRGDKAFFLNFSGRLYNLIDKNSYFDIIKVSPYDIGVYIV